MLVIPLYHVLMLFMVPDENYQFGAGVSAVSLLINNPNTFFRFHYF